MSDELDSLMERASEALAQMDYLTSEALCVEALGKARQSGAWDYFARIVLPLQEARRQRRMIAAEGVVRLGVRARETVDALLGHLPSGCIVLTHPFTADDASALQRQAKAAQRHIEVLFADNAVDAPMWTLRSLAGVMATVTMPAPPSGWRDRWIKSGEVVAADGSVKPGVTPADWFLDAMEALGDAALAGVDPTLTGVKRIDTLLACLEAVTDHEILHQRLADAARNLR